jgi:hypothetical protein
MIEPKKIIRQKRKTLSVTITPAGDVVVKAPIGLPDSEIFKFVREKESWILKERRIHVVLVFRYCRNQLPFPDCRDNTCVSICYIWIDFLNRRNHLQY